MDEVKSFPANINYLYEMLAFVREEVQKAGFDASTISRIELAVEEALVNIINYAYPKMPSNLANIEIDCQPLGQKNGMIISIQDKGIPYNPLEYKNTFQPEASLDDRSLGGYGIFFILNLMDEVNYKRENEHNVLSLIKYL